MLTLAQLSRNIVNHRAMIFALALRDLQNRYAGTLGGVLWAFMHPLAVVIIFYFVFAIGFRAQGPSGAPFIHLRLAYAPELHALCEELGFGDITAMPPAISVPVIA